MSATDKMPARSNIVRRKRKGSAAMEFALITPMIVFMLGAILEYGNFFYTKSIALQAAQDGARFGVQILPEDDPPANAIAIAEDSLTGFGMDCGGGDCSVTAQNITVSGIPILQVTVTIPHVSVFDMVPTPNNANGLAAMRMEFD